MTRATHAFAVVVVFALSQAASAAPARTRADNMPRGFTWPPSRAMIDAAHACEQRLDELGVPWRADKPAGRIVDAIVVPDGQIGGIAFVEPGEHGAVAAPVMDCQLVLALATIAPRLYELGVREVRIASAYRWSKVRVMGKTKDLLSRHALGLALDVQSVIDRDGREAVIAKDYRRGDQLLAEIEQLIDDSELFRMVLTPTNDPISHKDHFHVEANPDYSQPVDRPAV